MIIKIKGFETIFDSDGKYGILITFLNKTVFRSVVSEIISSISGNNRNDIIIEDGELLLNQKTLCLTDYFTLDFDDKGILGDIQNEISSSIILDSEKNTLFKEYINKLKTLIQNSCIESDVELSIDDEIKVSNFVKLFRVKVANNNVSNLVDLTIMYVETLFSLGRYKCFIFINLFSLFTNEEVIELLKFMDYKKINYCCFDSTIHDKINTVMNYEIDYDLYESHLN